MEARVARCLTCFHAAEEGLERPLYALDYVLHDLTVNLGILRHFRFDAGQLGFLLAVAN
jgi:hypothetical protein